MLNLKQITIKQISTILDKYFIDSIIDSDGDIFLESPSRTYISLPDDEKIIRFMAFIHASDLKEINEGGINDLIGYLNNSSYTVKYAGLGGYKNPKSIICEYSIVQAGNVDEEFILRTLKDFESNVSEAKITATMFNQIKPIIEKND